MLLFNHQLTRPFSNAKGSVEESSGLGATPVLSVTKFIHGEAKEDNKQFIYMNFSCFCFQAISQLIYFWFLKPINWVIWKQISHQFRYFAKIVFAVNNSIIQFIAKLKRSQYESLEQWYLLRSILILEMQPLLPRLTCHWNSWSSTTTKAYFYHFLFQKLRLRCNNIFVPWEKVSEKWSSFTND